MLVENGIDLDDFQTDHRFAVSDHFHGQVSFAVSDSAAYRSAYAGSVGGIYEIHVEADGDAGGVVHGILYGVGHHFSHAALVDVAHGEDVNAGFLRDFALVGIEIARADDDDIARLGLGLES